MTDESPGATNKEALWALIFAIPHGKCTSYGRLGQALPKPVSGFLVGHWMFQAPEGLPWWRVVSKDGSLPIDKLAPHLAIEQRQLLEHEGVAFEGDRVKMAECLHEPF